MESTLEQFFVSMATQSPVLLVYCIGIVLAIVWYARCPSASLATILAFVVLIANAIFFTALQIWLSRYMVDSGNFGDIGQALRWFYGVSHFGRSLVHGAALLLLLFAIYMGRSAPLPQKYS
jgi:hypothetical protein